MYVSIAVYRSDALADRSAPAKEKDIWLEEYKPGLAPWLYRNRFKLVDDNADEETVSVFNTVAFLYAL